MAARTRKPAAPKPDVEPAAAPITVDQLEALDRQVQMAQDQRLVYALTVSGASVPDASEVRYGPPRYPGVPEGSTFAPLPAGLSPVFPGTGPEAAPAAELDRVIREVG